MTQELRCNDRIRISPIRLIDDEGAQVGIVDTRDALAKAREAGLDLVEVAPLSRPPVCRIMDYGKWKYAQKKKDRKAKSHRHEQELKEVRIRTPKISGHDLEIKIQHARDFLQRGDRVQFTMWFRGREMAHQELGRQIFNSVKAALADVAKLERDMGMEGRSLSMLFSPTLKPKAPPKAGEGKAAGKAAAPSPPVAGAPVETTPPPTPPTPPPTGEGAAPAPPTGA